MLEDFLKRKMFNCHFSHILKNLGIQYFAMRDIDRLGIQRVMEMTFDHLLARLHIDIHYVLAHCFVLNDGHDISCGTN